MKNIKNILFLLIIVFVCPLFVMACGEEKYEDIPFTGSSLTGQEVITNIDNARTYMISQLGLRAKIETTNTYTFSKTTNDDIQENKTIKDVITTTIGNDKTNPTVSTVEKVRYENYKKKTRELTTFVKEAISSNEYISYCYTLFETFDEKGNLVESVKLREEYDSGYYDFLKLFNDSIVFARPLEIDAVYQKSFQGTSYYRLESKLNGYEFVRDRFEANSNIYNNPQLYTALSPEYDAPMPFMYEYGINGSGYITYARVNYSVINSDREKYLSVDSESRVVSYGDSLAALKKPSNVDDYTAETFMSTMAKENSYIVYRKQGTEENEYTDVTVIKIGKNNPNYSIKEEKYIAGTIVNTSHYFVKYDESSSTNYKSYALIDYPTKLNYEENDYVLDLLNYNFYLQFNKENTKDGVYHFGDATSYIKVSLTKNEISKITTIKGDITLDLNIHGYGNNIESLHMPTSLNGFTEIIPEPEPEENPGEGSGSNPGEGA